MPRAFDAQERERIRATLMTVGLQVFEAVGVRAARVGDIARASGIAKGSFYAFFPSKEELFMAIVEQREADHMAAMLSYLDRVEPDPARKAAGFFDHILARIESDPALNLMLREGEIEHLVRRIGLARFEAGHDKDAAFARQCAERWQASSPASFDPEDLLNLMAILLALASRRTAMLGRRYPGSVTLLRQLFVGRLAGTSR
jgi:AcrR family transcriptional regulator